MKTPQCSQHGKMVLRPAIRHSPESRFCGTWYDCPRCVNSVLYESPELKAQLAEQRAAIAKGKPAVGRAA